MFLKKLMERNNERGINNKALAATLAACVDEQGMYVVADEARKLQLEQSFMDTLGRFRRIYTMEDVRIGNTPKDIVPVFWDSSVILKMEEMCNQSAPKATSGISERKLTDKDAVWKEAFDSDQDFKGHPYRDSLPNIKDGYDKFRQSTYSIDGYIHQFDGYSLNWVPDAISKEKEEKKSQINIKLTETDVQDIKSINEDFFEGEATNSMLGRILLRKGIFFYKKLREKF